MDARSGAILLMPGKDKSILAKRVVFHEEKTESTKRFPHTLDNGHGRQRPFVCSFARWGCVWGCLSVCIHISVSVSVWASGGRVNVYLSTCSGV